MNHSTVFLAVLILSAVSVAAQPKVPPITIQVLIGPDKGGFVEPKNDDSMKDLAQELRGCSALRVVKAPTAQTAHDDFPQLLMTAWRDVDHTEGAFPMYFETLRTMTAPKDDLSHTKLIFKVGGYGQWRYAARQVVNELCDWAKANQARLFNGPPQ